MTRTSLVNDNGSEAPIQWPAASSAWGVVVILCLAGILSYTDRMVLSLLVDSVKVDMGISDTQMSLLLGLAFSIVYAIAGLPLGRLIDLRSRKMLLVFGVGMWTVGTVLCGLAQDFGHLFVARGVVGIGEATLAPAALSLIADLFPNHRRGLAIGAFMTSLVLGAGVALTIGGSLLHAAESGILSHLALLHGMPPWRVVLLSLGIPGAAVCVLICTIKEPRRQGVNSAPPGQHKLSDALRDLFALRGLVGPLLAATALQSAGDFSLLYWAPSLLGRVYHLKADQVGFLLGIAVMIGGVTGSMLAGLIGDLTVRQGYAYRRCLIASGGALLAVATGAIAFDGTPAISAACVGFWMLLSWGGQTLAAASLQDALPNRLRGIGVASRVFCNMALGLTIGTTATALLTDHVFDSPLSVGKSLACVVVPSAIGAALLYRRAAIAMRAAQHQDLAGDLK